YGKKETTLNMLTKLVEHVPIPQMYRIRQRFDDSVLNNPQEELIQKLSAGTALQKIQPGSQIAIAAGSRGIANLAEVVKVIVDAVKAAGAHPYIIPSMGS